MHKQIILATVAFAAASLGSPATAQEKTPTVAASPGWAKVLPPGPAQRANWLPAPKGDFSLYIRAYRPKAAVTDGSWTPPAVQPVE